MPMSFTAENQSSVTPAALWRDSQQALSRPSSSVTVALGDLIKNKPKGAYNGHTILLYSLKNVVNGYGLFDYLYTQYVNIIYDNKPIYKGSSKSEWTDIFILNYVIYT